MVEFLTFVLALAGFAGLTATMLLSRAGPVPRPLWLVTNAVVATHVLLVWMIRYEWQLAQATRNGYAGFVIFHTALAVMLTSTLLGDRSARRLILAAFAVVSVGALGAVFRYEVVAIYRVPVILLVVAGAAGVVKLRRR